MNHEITHDSVMKRHIHPRWPPFERAGGQTFVIPPLSAVLGYLCTWQHSPTSFDILGWILDKANPMSNYLTSILFRSFDLIFTQLEKRTSHWYVIVKGRTSIDAIIATYCTFVAEKSRNKTAKVKRILSWLHYRHANRSFSLKPSS